MRKFIYIIAVVIVAMLAYVFAYQNQSQQISEENITSQQVEEEYIFPNKAITVIAPYAIGGGTDSVARAIAQCARKYFPQPVVVVNRLGQGGARGIKEGIYAKNDGYTLTLLTVEINSLSALNLIEVDYTDLEPVILLNSEPGLLVVRKDFPFDSIEELTNANMQNDMEYAIGSSGKGSIWNIAAIGIENRTNLKFNHISYDGTSYAVLDVLGGKTDMVVAGLSEVSVHINEGELKVLTVLADERISEIPNVRTFKESGYDFSISTWRGLTLPKNVDDQTKQIIIEGFTKAAMDKDFQNIMKTLNLNYDFMDTKEFAAFLEKNYYFFKDITKNIKLDN
ncbi:MAG: tripartite tricarboxylate transporter substrate binding protein [Clostridia bacterium]|nr:tripartite tricarboxylate transporter substrate binding protein [Clostridia bacterium]